MPNSYPLTLSLIIPCYNEQDNLLSLFATCAKVANSHENIEFVFVDNGSTDNSPNIFAELLQEYSFARMVRVPMNQGYGFGILSGLRVAQGDILAWTHADLQTDPTDALKGMELFISSRHPEQLFVKGRRYGRAPWDVFFTVGMAFFEFFALRTLMWDINAQPTMFHKKFMDSWIDPPHDFSLDLYAYYQAKHKGLTIHRFPVYFGKRAFGEAHLKDLQSKIRYSKRTINYSCNLRKRLMNNIPR